MVKAKVFIYAKAFDGLPKVSDFKLIEEDLPEVKDGEFLFKAEYITVDPYMRAYAVALPVGSPFGGQQVAKIIESKNKDYPVGRYVVNSYGWRSHKVTNVLQPKGATLDGILLPDLGGLPASLGVGVLGMPGNTAYFGTLELLNPKPGETHVVSGAAGAVGSLVGQIAKIKGSKVIGIAGSDVKGKWLVEELGFDHFINYKTANIDKALKEYAPNGVDTYFDNVGGDITTTVLNHMNTFGRVSVCGVISIYNEKDTKAVLDERLILSKQIRVEGFIVTRWWDRWLEGINQMLQWIKEGKLKYKETVTEGFDKIPEAFIDMLSGGNTGKAVVKV